VRLETIPSTGIAQAFSYTPDNAGAQPALAELSARAHRRRAVDEFRFRRPASSPSARRRDTSSRIRDICVEPQSATKTPGISCFATVHQVRRLAANTFPAHAGQTVWELPAGTDFDDSVLRFWQPHPQRNPDKWFWSPARRMPGSDSSTLLMVKMSGGILFQRSGQISDRGWPRPFQPGWHRRSLGQATG
jgi:hypothetical protein